MGSCSPSGCHLTFVFMIAAIIVAKVDANLSGYAGVKLGVFVKDNGNVLELQPHTGLNSVFAQNEAAWGLYMATYNSTGWDILEVHTNPDMDDNITAFAAGYFEGAATAVRIEQMAANSGVPATLPVAVEEFLAANADYLSEMTILADQALPTGHADRRLWYQQQLISRQLEGLHAGYATIGRPALYEAEATVLNSPLTLHDFLVLQIGGDLEDLADIGTCNVSAKNDDRSFSSEKEANTPEFDPGRCSALVRLIDGNKDLLVSQDTWSGLESMLRIYKMYDFPFRLSRNERDPSRIVPGTRVSFSSYPGVLNSGDDFYVLSSGLIQMETTIGNSNAELASRFISPMSVLEWRRNIAANRLAEACTGPDAWSLWYRRFNSGTYNNQNFCVDFNIFTPGQPLRNGTVVISEQIPGFVVDTDVSARIQKTGYFGSYNTAYDPLVRELSDADMKTEQLGPWFGYETTARAEIFARDAPRVQSLTDMKKLMRSCDFTNDPLATQLDTCKFLGWTNCTPAYTAENCIATRGDLNPASGVWGISAFGHRNHVATDSKIAQFSTFNSSTVPADIICGPVGTNDNPRSTPTFVWSKSSFQDTVSHHGHPDAFTFPWVRVEFAP